MKTKIKLILTLLLALVVQFTFAQERTITGVVSDEMGPVADISVKIQGTTKGVITDFDGKYSIKANNGDTLNFSHVSYENSSVKIGAASNYNIVMNMTGDILEEVVINVAYGTSRKEAITGAVKVVTSKEIGEIQSANIMQGMTGKVSGVQVVQSSGQPGSAPIVRFRGIGSIDASSSPLYVVDGVPFNGSISSISSQDIASTTFLKDAAAAALYGNRGANGVVIITTKKGKSGEVKVSFDNKIGYTGRSGTDYNIISDPNEYLETRYNSVRNSLIMGEGLNPQTAANVAAQNLITNNNDLGTGAFPAKELNYNPYDVAGHLLIDPTTGKFNSSANLLYQEKWSDYLFKPSFKNETFLSVSKADEKSNIYFSLSYSNNKGYVVNSGFERITTQLKMETEAFKKAKIGAAFNYTNVKKNNVDGDGTSNYSNPFGWVRSIAPIYPVHAYDASGNLILDASGNKQFDDGTGNINGIVRPYGQIQNPAATIALNVEENKVDNFSLRTFIDYEIMENLKFTYNITGELYNQNYVSLTNPEVGDSADPDINGRIRNQNYRDFTLTHQQLLNWNYSFDNDKQEVAILVGHENSHLNIKVLDARKTNLLFSYSSALDHAAKDDSMSSYERDYSLDGYFSRLSYNFDKKYYLNASIRRDATSVFSPEERWGTFFGAGVSWRVSEEQFLQGNKYVSKLKLKASYGEQGNDGILFPGSSSRNYYAYKDQFGLSSTPDGSIAITQVYRGNKELTWETNENFNAGLELGILDNKINIEAEYFVRKVSDMLYNQAPVPSQGLPALPVNYGDMQNVGYELTVDADILNKKDFKWSVSMNATHYQNEITKLFKADEVRGLYKFNVGKSRYEYFIREYAGVNPVNGSSLYYKDVDPLDSSAGRILTENASEASKYYIGKTAIPDFYGGFSTRVEYKGFDLNLNFAYQLGGYGYDGQYWNRFDVEAGSNYVREALTDTWTPEHTDATLPRLDANDNQFEARASSMGLIDMSYLSVQNISLGFNIPQKFTKKFGVDLIRIYGMADNLAIWSKRKGYDPRQSLTGRSRNGYMITSTKTIGLTLNF